MSNGSDEVSPWNKESSQVDRDELGDERQEKRKEWWKKAKFLTSNDQTLEKLHRDVPRRDFILKEIEELKDNDVLTKPLQSSRFAIFILERFATCYLATKCGPP